MQQRRDVWQTSYNHTAAPKYSSNRKYPLSHVLSTVTVGMLAWTSFPTSTDQSHIWMSLLLLLSLAIRPWSQQPAQDQDSWPQKAEKNKFDRYPHVNLVPFILETTGRPGPHARKFISYLMRDADNPPPAIRDTWSAVQRVLHSAISKRQLTPPLRDLRSSLSFPVSLLQTSCWLMQVPSKRERTQRFQSQAYRSRAMRPCRDITSSDDDEHNTADPMVFAFNKDSTSKGTWSMVLLIVRGLLRRPSLSGTPTVTCCSVHIHNVVAKKRDASTDLLRRLHGYMKQHNVDFIVTSTWVPSTTVGDVFADPEFSAPGISFLWGLRG